MVRAKRTGFVTAHLIGQQSYAAVFFKESPTKEILLQLSKECETQLKLGSKVEFFPPEDFDACGVYDAAGMHVTNVSTPSDTNANFSTQKGEIPDTVWRSYKFNTSGIITMNKQIEECIQLAQVTAVGYSTDFGRIIITNSASKLPEKLIDGQIYELAVHRASRPLPPRAMQTLGTVVFCTQIGDQIDNWKLGEHLRKSSPWASFLPEFSKPVVEQRELVDTSAVQGRELVTPLFSGENSIVAFGVSVFYDDDACNVYIPGEECVYRVSKSLKVPLGVFTIYKMDDPINGIYSKCSFNDESTFACSVDEANKSIKTSLYVELQPNDKKIAFKHEYCGISSGLGRIFVPENIKTAGPGSWIKASVKFQRTPVHGFYWIVDGLEETLPIEEESAKPEVLPVPQAASIVTEALPRAPSETMLHRAPPTQPKIVNAVGTVSKKTMVPRYDRTRAADSDEYSDSDDEQVTAGQNHCTPETNDANGKQSEEEKEKRSEEEKEKRSEEEKEKFNEEENEENNEDGDVVFDDTKATDFYPLVEADTSSTDEDSGTDDEYEVKTEFVSSAALRTPLNDTVPESVGDEYPEYPNLTVEQTLQLKEENLVSLSSYSSSNGESFDDSDF